MAHTHPTLAYIMFAPILVRRMREYCAVVCKGFAVVTVVVLLNITSLSVAAVLVMMVIWGNVVGFVLV